MPVVHIEWLEGRSDEVRREVIRAVTDDIVRIAGAPPEAVHVVVTDVPRDHWATGGKLKSES